MNACATGLARFIEQTGDTDQPVDVASLVGGKNTYSDILWLVYKYVSQKRLVRFACDCALINIELIKPYTDEYELIINFLNKPNRDAAARAYYADAAYAAYADADAAAYAAAYAADAAAYADAAAAAAGAAAGAAYADAADAAAGAAGAAAYAAGTAYADADAGAADADAAAAVVNKLLIEMINEVEL